VFQPLCRDILNVLKSASGVLRIPLTATIWNLSSIRMMRNNINILIEISSNVPYWHH
jgi:hypothetical protein